MRIYSDLEEKAISYKRCHQNNHKKKQKIIIFYLLKYCIVVKNFHIRKYQAQMAPLVNSKDHLRQ